MGVILISETKEEEGVSAEPPQHRHCATHLLLRYVLLLLLMPPLLAGNSSWVPLKLKAELSPSKCTVEG